MNVEELFNDWRNHKPLNISLLTIATNGLNADTDKIIAFCEYNTQEKKCSTFFNLTKGEELDKASQFHLISPEVMSTMGIPEQSFRLKLLDVIKQDVIFVYNVPFFDRFIKAMLQDEDLKIPLYDISVIHKAVKNKYAFDDEQINSFDDFYIACMTAASPVPVGALSTQFKVSRTPVPGQLPFERMMELLQKVFSSCVALELQRFQS